MGYGLLGSVFNFVDPILDTIDPMHNKVQTWTTGSSTTEGQRPYFETIAPMVLDAFLPGVGSAVGAVDKASTGNWTGAGLSALGAMYGLGGFGGSTGAAADGASTGLQAEGATSGTTALSSTAGDAGGTVASAAPSESLGSGLTAPAASSYSSFEPASTGMQSVGGDGTGLLSTQSTGVTGGSLAGSTAAPSQYVGYGDKFNSAANASASQLAGSQPWYSKLLNTTNTTNAAKLGGTALQMNAQQQAAIQQRNMMMQERAKAAAMAGGGDVGGQSKPAASFQTLSPYAKFNGGFNPRRYGANVRQSNGLLG